MSFLTIVIENIYYLSFFPQYECGGRANRIWNGAVTAQQCYRNKIILHYLKQN